MIPWGACQRFLPPRGETRVRMAARMLARVSSRPLSLLACRSLSSSSLGVLSRALPVASAAPIRATSLLRPAFHVRYYAAGDAFTLNVPSMGDSITEGTIVTWTKGERARRHAARPDCAV